MPDRQTWKSKSVTLIFSAVTLTPDTGGTICGRMKIGYTAQATELCITSPKTAQIFVCSKAKIKSKSIEGSASAISITTSTSCPRTTNLDRRVSEKSVKLIFPPHVKRAFLLRKSGLRVLNLLRSFSVTLDRWMCAGRGIFFPCPTGIEIGISLLIGNVSVAPVSGWLIVYLYAFGTCFLACRYTN